MEDDGIRLGPVRKTGFIINLDQIIKQARDYLSNPATIQQVSEKRYASTFPRQEGLRCTANALTNSILYIENINPSRLEIDLDGSRTVRCESAHQKNIERFLRSTDSRYTEMRGLADVKQYVDNHLKDYSATHPKSGQDLLKQLIESQGKAAIVLVPGRQPNEIVHATMVYARKNKNQIELAEIDSLAGKERVISAEDFMRKLYSNGNLYDPFQNSLLIKKKDRIIIEIK